MRVNTYVKELMHLPMHGSISPSAAWSHAPMRHHAGTANGPGRAVFAFIFRMSLDLHASFAFTDIGSDKGEMMAYMHAAGASSCFGVEIQGGLHPDRKRKKSAGTAIRWCDRQSEEGCKPMIGIQQVGTTCPGFHSIFLTHIRGLLCSLSLSDTHSDSQVFEYTTGSLGNAETPVSASYGTNIALEGDVVPDGWAPHSNEARCILSFDVG